MNIIGLALMSVATDHGPDYVCVVNNNSNHFINIHCVRSNNVVTISSTLFLYLFTLIVYTDIFIKYTPTYVHCPCSACT